MAVALSAMLLAGGVPVESRAQVGFCDRNLSTLEADIDALEQAYRASDRRMQALISAVDRIYDDAMKADLCPEGTSDRTAQQRTDVTALAAADLVARSEANLQCSQGFVGRVSRDIAKAQAANDSAMVVRLNSVSKRILDLDTRATQIAIGIAHLALQQARQVKVLDQVDSQCGQMDSVYE